MAEDNSTMDLEDQGRLIRTQNVRERIIAEMTKDGKIPEDKEDRQFLLAALDGSDRVVLTKARIKSNEKAVQGQQQMAAMVSQMLTQVVVSQVGKRPDSEPIDLSAEAYQVMDLVPGETDVGTQHLTFDAFFKAEGDK